MGLEGEDGYKVGAEQNKTHIDIPTQNLNKTRQYTICRHLRVQSYSGPVLHYCGPSQETRPPWKKNPPGGEMDQCLPQVFMKEVTFRVTGQSRRKSRCCCESVNQLPWGSEDDKY